MICTRVNRSAFLFTKYRVRPVIDSMLDICPEASQNQALIFA
jgi:hypothetical protein